MAGSKGGIGKCPMATPKAEKWAENELLSKNKKDVKRKFTQEAFIRDDISMTVEYKALQDEELYEEELS